MAALSRHAHRRRVLEHQAEVEADRGKPVPTPIPSSSDLQLKIRLIGEVKRTDETVKPKRGRRRSRKRAQPDRSLACGKDASASGRPCAAFISSASQKPACE